MLLGVVDREHDQLNGLISRQKGRGWSVSNLGVSSNGGVWLTWLPQKNSWLDD